MGSSHPQWFPMLATPNIVAIAEECDCICKEDGPCCCHGNQDSISDQVIRASPQERKSLLPLEEFDGIDDILAVSHVADKPSLRKKKPPLLRAKTLPAIITPSLSIIQAQLEASSPSQEESGSLSGGKPRRMPSAAADKGRSNKWHLLVEDDGSSSRSPTSSPRHSVSSTGSTSSHHSGKESSSKSKHDHSGTPSSRVGLAKLARLLTPKEKSSSTEKSCPGNDSPLGAEVACFSWNRAASSMRKANSIDSLLDSSLAGYTLDIDPSASPPSASPPEGIPVPKVNKPIPSSPSVPAKLESHKRGNIPTSPSMPNKLAKGTPVARQSSVEQLLESVPLTKAERKRLEKVNKFNIDLQALFAAVEHQNVERARSILEITDVDVNSVNGDGFSPLDIAVMTNDVAMVKLLQSCGATESFTFSSQEDSREASLTSLVKEAGKCVEDLATCVFSTATNGSLSAALLKEKERQLSLWERRHQLLKRMKAGFDLLRPPDSPTSVQLEIVGTRSLKVKFVAPDTANEAESIVTKYKVDWSTYEDFTPLAGSQEIFDVQKLEVAIPDLTQGTTYYVRVAAGNAKGYSAFQCTCPLSATPSSWRDVDRKKQRTTGHLGNLDDLFHQLINSRPAHAAEVKAISDGTDTPQQQRRQVRKSIRNLFAPAPKFQKTMKRGAYLACLLYHDDRVLVTPEETLPILEVDETYPSSLHTDFHWMMKVACTWEDVKTLRQDLEKSHSSSSAHFRSKLLQTVEQMQTALGLQDLGQLFYRPLKDSEGTVLLCTAKCIPDPKSLITLSVRWLPLSKIQRKRGNSADPCDTPTVSELLLDSLQDIMTYNRVSTVSLPRGLYLGYVKLNSSVDLIRVLVTKKNPNVLLHCRVRENPHVSRAEWEWLKSLDSHDKPTNPTEVQMKFQRALSSAARSLLTQMDILQSQADNHRLYDAEVIELSDSVSFLLLLPPADSVCSVPGQWEEVTHRSDCILLPVQIFEMIHMTTYQPSFISRYSRLSCILEMDTMVARHAHREAFSSSEVATAKTRLGQLQDFQVQAENTWRAMRWIMDVLTFARDKQNQGGIPLCSVWAQKTGSPSPLPSPQQSPVQQQQPVTSPRPPRDDSDHYLRISNIYSLDDPRAPSSQAEMRRCASTSRLQASAAHDGEPATGCPKAHSAEKLSSRSPSEEGLSREKPEAKQTTEQGGSVRSSFTGSFKSTSSRDAEVCREEEASIHSKDSACSVGEDGQYKRAEDSDDVNQEYLRPSSSTSNSSCNSDCQSGIIRVYAAYDTGLPSGTSVKLFVTPQTTAREVVDLVVKQLNMAVILKGRGSPIYGNTHLHNFCLVAVVGSRERCLRDDFHPLQLQNPWTKGKLFVRLRGNHLQHSSD